MKTYNLDPQDLIGRVIDGDTAKNLEHLSTITDLRMRVCVNGKENWA